MAAVRAPASRSRPLAAGISIAPRNGNLLVILNLPLIGIWVSLLKVP